MDQRCYAAVFLMCILFGCDSSSEKSVQVLGDYEKAEEIDYLVPARIDSFDFDKNSGLFLNRIASLDRDVFLKNRIFLFSRAGLQVAVVDLL